MTTLNPQRGEWTYPGHTLPTLEGFVSGTVAINDNPKDSSRPLFTVQCSTCHATYTDDLILVFRKINFAPTINRDSVNYGAVPFRRCPACCEAGLEPANAAYLRHVQHAQQKARGVLVLSDEYFQLAETARRSDSGRESFRAREKTEAMLRACDEAAEADAAATWEALATDPADLAAGH